MNFQCFNYFNFLCRTKLLVEAVLLTCFIIAIRIRRGSRNFSKGGIEVENFERKMFVDTRINACTQTCNSFSFLPFQEDYNLIFALFYYSFLFLKFEDGGGGVATVIPPLDPPMIRATMQVSDVAVSGFLIDHLV